MVCYFFLSPYRFKLEDITTMLPFFLSCLFTIVYRAVPFLLCWLIRIRQRNAVNWINKWHTQKNKQNTMAALLALLTLYFHSQLIFLYLICFCLAFFLFYMTYNFHVICVWPHPACCHRFSLSSWRHHHLQIAKSASRSSPASHI